jgi:Xaa-Pro aminopeptidase
LAIAKLIRRLEEQPYAGLLEAARAAFKEKGLTSGAIGFDDVRFKDALGDGLRGVRAVDATNLLLEVRMVKTREEIGILREAAQKNAVAIRAAIDAISAGATWGEIYRTYEITVASQGARVFATYNGAGHKSAGAGRLRREYPIRPGDQVCFDAMLKWRRYMGDAQRTAVLGEPSPKLMRYWRAYLAGIEEGYGGMRPGVATGDLRNRVISAVRKAGLSSFELAFTHGIGLDHIEVPFIAGGQLGDFPIREDMVLNLDMELHEIGWGGLFFEESILITHDSAERLYELPRELFVV